MSKELEDKKYYLDVVDNLEFAEMYFEANEMKSLVEYLFTPPTTEEVCEALSEYYKMNVNYNNEDKPMFYRYLGGIKKNVIAILDNDGLLSFPFGTNLPPHLITLIGRFYEGVEQK